MVDVGTLGGDGQRGRVAETNHGITGQGGIQRMYIDVLRDRVYAGGGGGDERVSG